MAGHVLVYILSIMPLNRFYSVDRHVFTMSLIYRWSVSAWPEGFVMIVPRDFPIAGFLLKDFEEQLWWLFGKIMSELFFSIFLSCSNYSVFLVYDVGFFYFSSQKTFMKIFLGSSLDWFNRCLVCFPLCVYVAKLLPSI